MTIAQIPVTIAGDWGDMLNGSVQLVLERARGCCLYDLALCSDEQPTELRVERHLSGSPAVWLHEDSPQTAVIIVSSGERDWSQLAYQFGHELGHVVANSWLPDSVPKPPSHWLEEALVEAFSLCGLERLAASWAKDPPFPNDNAFGEAITKYQSSIIRTHLQSKGDPINQECWAPWFRKNHRECETNPNLNDHAKFFSVSLVEYFSTRPKAISALCALNRWPDRSALPFPDYLEKWRQSCRDLGVSAMLPEDLIKTLS